MKIAIISHSYLSEENRKNLAGLVTHGIQLNIIVPYEMESRIFSKIIFKKDINNHIDYKAYKTINFFGSQYILITSDMGFRQFQPDIVHVEYDPWSAIFWQAFVFKLIWAPKAKVICTIKKNTFRDYAGVLGLMKRQIAQNGIDRVDHFIAVNRGVMNIYETRFHIDKTKISKSGHLGVDTEAFCPRNSRTAHGDKQPIHVGFCGRFDEEKGVMDLFQAVKNCRDEMHREILLKYLGDGELKGELAEMVKENKWVELLSPIPHNQVAEFLTSLDIFVLPSHIRSDHEEHDAHALLEALACGLPSIGASSGIIPEILGDGTGLLIQPGSIEELSQALKRLINDYSLRIKLGQLGRVKILENFSIEKLAKHKMDIYRKILNEN